MRGMNMKRKLVMVLLALGVVGGYGAGIAHALNPPRAACAGGKRATG